MVMRDLHKLALNRIKSYKKAKEGATAIEFALLAIPFFALLFAILELSIIFLLSSTLSHAVSESGRQIRTGNFQNCGQAAFKASVCSQMNIIGICEDNLRIDLVSQPTFSTITLPDPPEPPEPDPNDGTIPDITNGVYVETGAGAPVVVRALYYHRLILPAQLTRLETIPNSNTRIVSVTTAFQNEPFPANGCPSAGP